MAPSTLNPKKLKVVLTSLREAITSLEKNGAASSSSPSSHMSSSTSCGKAFRLLLVSELASRGAGVDLPTSSDDEVAAAKSLLEAIGLVAGRAPIDDANVGGGGGGGGGASSSYPPPMMAASNAASGMAASACRACLPPDDDTTSSSLQLLPAGDESVRDALRDAMERCLEVEDGRFYVLLKLARDAHAEGVEDDDDQKKEDSGGGSSSSSSAVEKKRRERRRLRSRSLRRRFAEIAYSHYLYGATNFARDQPPMWKRCLDASLECARLSSSSAADGDLSATDAGGGGGGSATADYESYRNSLTVLPLRNMIRIAKSKGNEKRVEELSLFLSVGCLGGVQERLDRMKAECSASSPSASANNKQGKEEEGKRPKLDKLSTEELLHQYYLRRALTLVEMEDSSTCETLLESARASLAASNCSRDDDDSKRDHESRLLYHYVQFRIGHLAEESAIWTEVRRQHRAMLNRRPEGSGGGRAGGGGIGIGSKKSTAKSIGAKTTTAASSSTATTAEEMERRVRSQSYLDAWTAWKSSDDADSLSPPALRDAVISSAPSLPPAARVVRDCYAGLTHQVDRLVEIAAVIVQPRGDGRKGPGTAEDALRVWHTALRFVSPLMTDHLHPLVVASDGESGSNENLLEATLRRLVERCSEAIVSACWMREPSAEDDCEEGKESCDASRLLRTAHACLTACQRERAAEEKRLADVRKGEASVLSSRDERSATEKRESQRFRCALTASQLSTELRNAATTNGEDDQDEASADALVAAARGASAVEPGPDSRSLSAGSFGAPYLRFLSAWSGAYDSPWPFCSLGRARSVLKDARDARATAGKAWGRDTSSLVERVLLDVGEADLEGGLAGGRGDVAAKLYRGSLDMLTGDGGAASGRVGGMLKVHCLLGLAKLSLSSDDASSSDETASAERYARDALDVLSSLDDPAVGIRDGGCRPVPLCVYPWTVPSLERLSRSYYVCASRRLVAEACLRSSRPEDARAFLTEAVKDLPGNYEAAFALAAFHLRLTIGDDRDDGKSAKKTRTLLLKAAKMGMETAKPDPFALLGIWYESQKDPTRAEGCYRKALATNPSHPVAGRGLRRLLETTTPEQLHTVCKNAATRNSPSNGWAWRVLGRRNARGAEGGDDAAAAVCFQQALRRRDVRAPGNDVLGAFYADPTASSSSSASTDGGGPGREVSETWAELAACYRRMGKHSAALRAYEAAYDVSDGDLPPDALCAWAQVDLDLGLYEEAAEKCDRVLLCSESSSEIQRMAAYIEGEALLFLARRDVQEGKFGSSLSHLERGIARLAALPADENSPADSYYCEVKLLGDLHSSGNSLPSYVFAAAGPSQDAEHERKMGHLPLGVENQISFMMKGERAYALAFELGKNGIEDDEDDKCLVAASLADIGSNLLSQARIVSMALGEGSGGGTKTSLSDLTTQSSQIKDLIIRSINAYLNAVDASPHEAPAWCGLGCALIAVDPLLSQHAFSRALQIDPSLADPWSHISLLYANSDTEKCSEILDYLTQVEDTPLMWIGRGFLLEKTSRDWKGQDFAREGCLTKAADAYRAALQIMQHPAALLGLSLTCRRADPGLQKANNLVYSSLADRASKLESRMAMAIHQNMTGDGNIGASYVSGLTQIEEGLNRLRASDGSGGLDLVAEADVSLRRASVGPKNEGGTEREPARCEIDFSVSTALTLKKSAEFPHDLIKTAMVQASTASLGQCPDRTRHLRDSCDTIDEARSNVVLNPESGEAWLIFAEKLAQELTFEAKDVEMLSSAKIAAKRAYDLLRNRVVNAALVSPQRQALKGNSIEYSDKSVVSSLPSASLFSQSTSLVAWLEEAETLDNGESGFVSNTNFALLQEAMLLDPSNPIAAASLALSN